MVFKLTSSERVKKVSNTFMPKKTGIKNAEQNITDQFRFLGNCPPTPPQIKHFALSEN